MLDTSKLTTSENISLSRELGIAKPSMTPFLSLLLNSGHKESATAKTHHWVSKSYDTTADISAVEGADAETFINSGRAEMSNILQIHSKATSVSGTVAAMPFISAGDILAEEVNDRLVELGIALNKSLLVEKRNDGSLTPFVRKMDGLMEFIDESNILTPAAELTEKVIKDLAGKLYTAGFNNDMYLLCNADMKDKIDSLPSFVQNYNYNHVNENFGILVNSINTNFGIVRVILENSCPDDTLVMFDLDAVKIAFLREPQYQPLAVVGDSQRGLVVAESTLRVNSKKAVASFTLGA